MIVCAAGGGGGTDRGGWKGVRLLSGAYGVARERLCKVGFGGEVITGDRGWGKED